MSARLPLFFLLLFSYGVLFSLQDARFSESSQQLAHPLPPAIQKIALGYLRQLGGEMQFIKASVFYGGVKPGRDPLEYTEPLAQHFIAAATLHPQFIDTYFLCQATLPDVNSEYARYANTVLARGMTALPDNYVLPFFAGFNHFYYLNEPLEAARLFHLAAKRPNGPPVLEHLANILSAEGGNIYAALIGLRGMYASEKDERVKKRYAEEIAAFEKAVTVLNAVQRHEKMTGTPPAALNDLVPEYLPAIPDIGPVFTLEWKPPHLQVVRVAKKKSPRR
ncbi:MAG: hypothetical protein ACYDIB_09105 [Desulfobulbia bacterium]